MVNKEKILEYRRKLRESYEEGLKAALEGIQREGNPYEEFPEDLYRIIFHFLWDKGWTSQKSHMRGEKESEKIRGILEEVVGQIIDLRENIPFLKKNIDEELGKIEKMGSDYILDHFMPGGG